jgi:hypothetical protein
MLAVKGFPASNGKDGNAFYGARKPIFQATRFYRHERGDIPRNSLFFLFLKTRATTNTFKSQLRYLLHNGYIARITRGIYQITPKGKNT